MPNILKIQTLTPFKVQANNNNNLYKIQITKKNIKIIMISVNRKISQNQSEMVHLTISNQMFHLIKKKWENIK